MNAEIFDKIAFNKITEGMIKWVMYRALPRQIK